MAVQKCPPGTVGGVKVSSIVKDRRVWAGSAIVVAAAVGTTALVLSTQSPPLDAREQARGVTNTVTVAAPAPGPKGQLPAQPRPTQLPALIEASGQCKVALDNMRGFLERVPSGLAPRTVAQNAEFNAYLTAIVGTPTTPGACDAETATKFRAQEVAPWLTWAVPPGYTAPPEPSKPTPTGAKMPVPKS